MGFDKVADEDNQATEGRLVLTVLLSFHLDIVHFLLRIDVLKIAILFQPKQ